MPQTAAQLAYLRLLEALQQQPMTADVSDALRALGAALGMN